MDDNSESTVLARERTRLANERTRLANERTFLAWTRTGLASVAGGLAIIRFLVFQNFSHLIISKMIGCLLVILGIAIFGFSFIDYKNSYKKLKIQQDFSVWTTSTISFTLIIIALMLLLIEFNFLKS